MTDAGANAGQADWWNNAAAPEWIRFEDSLDFLFASVTARLIERAAPAAGESVLDIGCGAGANARAFAAQVGPAGAVTALDISGPLLGQAASHPAAESAAPIEYLLADAQTHAFSGEGTDLAVSRFGVMFFDDPVTALKNIGGALRPGGRMMFAAWSPITENPWFGVARDAAVAVLGKPSPASPDAPGPMAFQDLERVAGLFRQAGLSDIEATQDRVHLHHPGPYDEIVENAASIGPASRVIIEFGGGPEDVAKIRTLVAEGLQQYREGDGVSVPASLNMFGARRG